jgi:hypothetical protein
MNLPGENGRDRRAVPRHIRDGEHDMLAEAVNRDAPRRSVRPWICVAVLLAGGVALWIALRPTG